MLLGFIWHQAVQFSFANVFVFLFYVYDQGTSNDFLKTQNTT